MKAKQAVAIVLIVLIVFALGVSVEWLFNTQPYMVQVAGQVATIGYGTYPMVVSFNIGSKLAFSFIARSDPAGGYAYSGSVTNHQTYIITIAWKGSLGALGTCTVGYQTIDANIFTSQPIIHDVSC